MYKHMYVAITSLSYVLFDSVTRLAGYVDMLCSYNKLVAELKTLARHGYKCDDWIWENRCRSHM